MNQTWQNGKKPSFRTDVGPFAQIWLKILFFHGFYRYYMLDILASYHCMQFQGKLMNQTWENQTWFYLCYMLDIVESYNCMQF